MRERLEAEAVALLSRVHADAAPLDAMLALEAWEARSDDHRAALARVTRAWAVAGMTGVEASATAALPPSLPRHEPRREPRRGWRLRARAPVWAASAATAAMAVAAAFILIPSRHPTVPVTTVYSTPLGKTRTVALADGSRILLGADSRLSVGTDNEGRSVQLMAGQALFTVRHDASRPFTVAAGDAVIRDFGTIFSVTRHPDAVVVSVAEGEVEASATDVAATRLVAGQQLRIGAGGGAMTTVAREDVTAWTTGRLSYDRAPLSDVVADVNRYATTPLRLDDPATARLTYSGTVRADAIAEWVNALPYAFPVTVRRGDEAVVIALRPGRAVTR